MDGVVLDDPSLGPVRPDQTGLVRSGRRLGARCLGEFEATHGDGIYVVLGRVGQRTLISTSSSLGSALWKFAQIVILLVNDFGAPEKSGLLGVAYRDGCPGPVIDHLRTDARVGERIEGVELARATAVEVDLTRCLRGAEVAYTTQSPFTVFANGMNSPKTAAGSLTRHTVPSLISQPVIRSEPLMTTWSPVTARVGGSACVAEAPAGWLDPFAYSPTCTRTVSPGCASAARLTDGSQRVVLGAVVEVRSGDAEVESGGHEFGPAWRVWAS